jgi:hypothetical protein
LQIATDEVSSNQDEQILFAALDEDFKAKKKQRLLDNVPRKLAKHEARRKRTFSTPFKFQNRLQEKGARHRPPTL